ncbi:hypothetical protein LOAG_06061 [Loa loa]|uniref:Uncharacterized protein n=1 Tax=Loa loa TaxID=7209 RepID=A0A1S0U0G3_LOALO|nr:hypothetical protein LOAG_06061 [Loa loa]EFO22426.1 hypothetical protein LOAG_06061 [Loa loa]
MRDVQQQFVRPPTHLPPPASPLTPSFLCPLPLPVPSSPPAFSPQIPKVPGKVSSFLMFSISYLIQMCSRNLLAEKETVVEMSLERFLCSDQIKVPFLNFKQRAIPSTIRVTAHRIPRTLRLVGTQCRRISSTVTKTASLVDSTSNLGN